jgi:hypothetical protein
MAEGEDFLQAFVGACRRSVTADRHAFGVADLERSAAVVTEIERVKVAMRMRSAAML